MEKYGHSHFKGYTIDIKGKLPLWFMAFGIPYNNSFTKKVFLFQNTNLPLDTFVVRSETLT